MENNINHKYLMLVRKLKEGFLSFNDDLLEVFPQNKNLFIQRIISYQLPDTVLYKLLKNNINFEFIENKDEYYLKHELYFLKNYNNYISCGYKKKLFIQDLFTFHELSYDILDENINTIWNWLSIFNIIINQIKIVENL